MGSKLPTFFQDTKKTYALFPGAPARGLSEETTGAWTMALDSVPLNMRWAIFQHVCSVLCSYQEPKAWVGIYERERMSFGGPESMQSHLKIVLTSLRLGQIRWAWALDGRAMVIPEDARWFSPSSLAPQLL